MEEGFKVKYHLEGLKDFERAMMELPKAASRRILARVFTKAMGPMQAMAKAKAPKRTGKLSRSIIIGAVSKLTKSQRAKHKKESSYELFFGAFGSPRAHLQEFGTRHHRAQPFMRPAWDAHAEGALVIIMREMSVEIEAERVKLAKKAERLAAKIRSGAR